MKIRFISNNKKAAATQKVFGGFFYFRGQTMAGGMTGLTKKIARPVDKRASENAESYKNGKQLAEHPFGTVKGGFGLFYFLTRVTESVKTESCLHFLVNKYEASD